MLFQRERDLEKAILKVYEKALKEVGERTRDILKRLVENDWYKSRPESPYYDRTMDFLNSITFELITKGQSLEANIFFDVEKILPSLGTTPFGHHQSFDGSTSYRGKSISWYLVGWIEEGVVPIDDGYYVGNQPIEGIHMLYNTAKWLEDNVYNVMNKVFKKYGIPLIPINY